MSIGNSHYSHRFHKVLGRESAVATKISFNAPFQVFLKIDSINLSKNPLYFVLKYSGF